MSLKDPTLAKLKSMGAETIGGDVYLNRVKVAILRHDTFMITPEGEEAIKQADAASAPAAVAAPAAPAASAGRKKKDPPAPPATTPAPTEPGTNLDDLLGDEDPATT